MNELSDLESRGITPIGRTNFRNQNKLFGIKQEDRLGHIYVIGKTGVGKSTLLLNMAKSDIRCGRGLAILDPHGDLSQELVKNIPDNRQHDLVYFDVASTEEAAGFNPLIGVDKEHHHLAASGLVSTFKKIWSESWGPRLEHILRFALLTLLEYGNATILDIQPLLTDQSFRRHVLMFIQDEPVRAFWLNEFEKYSPSLKAEAVAPIINKISLFSTSIPLRKIVSQRKGNIDMSQILNSGKIFIVNLSKGLIGEDASSIMGSMLVTSIQLTAMKRANLPPDQRKLFYLYIDEAHSFITLSFADILAEARKYGLGIFMAHQYIEQLPEKIQQTVFGNVGTILAFKIGAVDAEHLEREFYPEFTKEDLINLDKFSICLKLKIDGTTSRPFSAKMV